jgi:UPF0176 protein
MSFKSFGTYTVLAQDCSDAELKNNPIVITTFYNFAELSDPFLMRDRLKDFCLSKSICGTILLGTEGLNSTISGSMESIESFYQFYSELKEFNTSVTDFRETYYKTHPFSKLKVRVKREIVTSKNSSLSCNPGQYIEPEEWDSFIKREDVILIDTRNDYEYQIGAFEGSVNPDIENFRDFNQWFAANKESFKNKKVAMFCTGGIRCEKSTTFAQEIGMESYHLKGGIISYFIKTKNKNDAWKGKCFVFDDRVVIDPSLSLDCN